MASHEDQQFIIYPQKFSLWKIFLGKRINLHDYCKCSDESCHLDSWNDVLKMVLSIVFMNFLNLVSKPLAEIGDRTEFILNLFALNGGLIETIKLLLTGKAKELKNASFYNFDDFDLEFMVNWIHCSWFCETGKSIKIPDRNSDTYLSMIGLLDSRTNLYRSEDSSEMPGAQKQKSSSAGDRFYADLSVMASNLAYENELVIQHRVAKQWKMHFVKFYSLWNGNVRKKSTQAFIFCDKKVDANVIVLAFRGTEPFNADDWMTDADLSWYQIPNVGRIHVGFMEAMGVANRHEEDGDVMKKLCTHQTLDSDDDDKRPSYYTLVEELQSLTETHKNAKILVTGHSLGGALAVLFSALLFLKKQQKLLEKMMAVYTFGQPRVGDEEFGNFMDRNLNQPKPRYYRVVYCNDLVPRVPFDDKFSQFKHFGRCLYYNSLYQGQNRAEEPNRNFSPLLLVSVSVNALWETVVALILPLIKGPDYRQTRLCILMRIVMGPLFPGMVSHFLVNYINCIRLGPSPLRL